MFGLYYESKVFYRHELSLKAHTVSIMVCNVENLKKWKNSIGYLVQKLNCIMTTNFGTRSLLGSPSHNMKDQYVLLESG